MNMRLEELTEEEASRFGPVKTYLDLSEYVDTLRTTSPGKFYRAEILSEGERTTKRRLSLAGKQLGMKLQWSKSAPPNTVQFLVKGSGEWLPPVDKLAKEQIDSLPPAPSRAPAPTPISRTGRPRRR